MKKEPWARAFIAGEDFHWKDLFDTLDVDNDGNIDPEDIPLFSHISLFPPLIYSLSGIRAVLP